MDIFNILTMIGGLALFLYGMSVMGDGLMRFSGGKLESILEKLTDKRIKGLLLGVVVTAAIQSSSATTVMVVGFVNSGIMKLSQAVGVIMGANIGTTVTSWILSLTGIQSDNILLSLLKPSAFAPVLAAIGIYMYMKGKDGSKSKNGGMILLGFAVLMFGMETMSGAVAPLSDSPAFVRILTLFSNPLFGIAAGAIVTAAIQSSSASVGILQALCISGAINYSTAIPIIMGQNIGTCVTALLSSMGAGTNARRASFIHLYFNLIGTVVFTTLFYAVNHIVGLAFVNQPATAAGIALIHSIFNVCCTLMLFPFGDKLVKLAIRTVPETGDTDVEIRAKRASEMGLDERFLERPSFAIQRCKAAANEMAEKACDAFLLAMDVLKKYDKEKAETVIRLEQECDEYEDIIGTYLVKLSGRDLSREDGHLMSLVLHAINDYERISDHAINVVEAAQEMQERKISMTSYGSLELDAFSTAIRDILMITDEAFIGFDRDKARQIEPLEEVVDNLNAEMRQRHIDRLRKGMCSMEAGIILEDILIYFERVSDHCSNIALCLIEIEEDSFGRHEYVSERTKGSDPDFQDTYTRMRNRYTLPKIQEGLAG
ncbi:MAG: Na/Pi cotransporter family protein [Mogibacterium sp.]|nr:Na/Pi cotransporter family protein [Mogibacterium sp.]MBQ6315180.1 Na/Pi cotransporter family protein [Mogibacterium sp.]